MTTMELPASETGLTRRNRPFRTLRVAEVHKLCADATAITLDVPVQYADEFAFTPGQSVTVRRTVDGIEQRRTYSICAPVGDSLRIGVREVPGGAVSGWLVHAVSPGDEIDVQPPAGSFTADPATATAACFSGVRDRARTFSRVCPTLSSSTMFLSATAPGGRGSTAYASTL